MNKTSSQHKAKHERQVTKDIDSKTKHGKSEKKKKSILKKLQHEHRPSLKSVLKSLELKHSDAPTVDTASTSNRTEHVHPTKLSVYVQPNTDAAANKVETKVADEHVSVEDKHEEVSTKKSKFVDLYPWPFEKTFKGVIRHRDWNALVQRIQDAVDCDSAHENDHLHEEIAHLLDERDALQSKLNEMREYILKEHREFEAHFN